jgi:hypothetical protein
VIRRHVLVALTRTILQAILLLVAVFGACITDGLETLPVRSGNCRLSNWLGSLTRGGDCHMSKEAFTCTCGITSAALILVSCISARPHQCRHYLYTIIYGKPCSSTNTQIISADCSLYQATPTQVQHSGTARPRSHSAPTRS